MQNFDDLVYENPTALKTYVCDEIVDRFREDDRTYQGITTKGENTELKKSLDLAISTFDDWKTIDDLLFKSISENLTAYIDKLSLFTDIALWNNTDITDNGYTVKQYEPGDYFHWHVDRQMNQTHIRTLAYIWYLNDSFEKGETEFLYGRKIKPEKGKLLIFPACWTYPHRGLSPENGNKYIITSFLSSNETAEYE